MPRQIHNLHKTPPLDFIGIEILYFILIVGICLVIYFKTKEIYELTRHRGIFFFRNVMLYFALSYFFRMFHVLIPIIKEYFYLPPNIGRFSLILVGYFSTIAILSIGLSVLSKKVKYENHYLVLLTHYIALLFTFVVFYFKSNKIMMLIQTVLFMGIIILVLINNSTKISFNRISYILLFFFWVLNVLTFSRLMVPINIRTILYGISVLIFFSILYRVNKRVT